MWFDDTLNDAWLNGFHSGISAAGFRPVRIDAKDYVGGFSDEIMRRLAASHPTTPARHPGSDIRPAIIGAVNTRDESSAAVGRRYTRQRSRPLRFHAGRVQTKRPDVQGREVTPPNKGGNACPTSAAPSHTSPYPVPRANASIRRIEAAASMSGPSSWSSTLRRP
jgi:hypothetical protein